MGKKIDDEDYMIEYEKYTLDNGLTLLLHSDSETPMVTVNTLYAVGARDENADCTGLAHLFEHLMFGGTVRYPDYDKVVETVGGESNAFTSNDYTNYYITVPAGYLEQALDLEFDRMRGLDWSEQRLAVQQRVVTEEYNQRYINQPYGDVMLLLRPLCFKRSPYRWCTIGADIRHVAEASLIEVRAFFDKWYRPENAVMALAGNFDCREALDLVSRFAMPESSMSGGARMLPLSENAVFQYANRIYATEPPQCGERRMEVTRDVPADALYKAYPMCGRTDADFVVCDMISDVLSNGKSSRLYNSLVRERQLFSEISAYVLGDRGEGLFVVSGRLNDGASLEDAERALDNELERLAVEGVSDDDLRKVAGKYESTFVFSHYKASDRALALCHFEWLGHIEWVNREPELYWKVSPEDVRRVAGEMFRKKNSNVLWYRRKTERGE